MPLLRSEDLRVVRSGAFIAGELAGRAAPLMPEIGRLLAHGDGWVKSDLLSTMMDASTPADGETVAAATMLVDDENGAIRAEAWFFLGVADRSRLEAALPHLDDEPVATGVAWLVGSEAVARSDDGELKRPARSALNRHTRAARRASRRRRDQDR